MPIVNPSRPTLLRFLDWISDQSTFAINIVVVFAMIVVAAYGQKIPVLHIGAIVIGVLCFCGAIVGAGVSEFRRSRG